MYPKFILIIPIQSNFLNYCGKKYFPVINQILNNDLMHNYFCILKGECWHEPWELQRFWCYNYWYLPANLWSWSWMPGVKLILKSFKSNFIVEVQVTHLKDLNTAIEYKFQIKLSKSKYYLEQMVID